MANSKETIQNANTLLKAVEGCVPYYPIQLDKVRNLRYGMKALSLIEKKLKKPVSKIDMDDLTMEDAATLIWAGLQHEDKDLTPDKVMDLVDEYSNIPAVMQAMGEAFAAAFGADAPEEDAKNE
jgi:hypothetical protein